MTIPVYLLTGFLGSGKTTLLKTLLLAVKEKGNRPAVLMNEFGKASVDTLLIQGAAVPTVDLIEGCVCCTVRGSLTAAMMQLVQEHRPDVIFLEATGVALPLEIVDSLLDPPVKDHVQLKGIFACVDATRFPLQLPPPFEQTPLQLTMVQQVRHADVLLVTKADLTAPDRRFALESALRQHNQNAPLVRVLHGEADAEMLLSVRAHHLKRALPTRLVRKSASQKGKHALQAREKTSFGGLQTLHYEFRSSVDVERFYQFLYRLPESVARAKGFFRDAESGQMQLFHFTPHAPMIAAADGEMPAFAVLIGEELAEQELVKQLQACEVKKPPQS
ncbi:CobW family GTP-binding protein [Tumebacillus lipolyticus]|uniref:CobW family GTP-binding protein n=1 Tax=Tumebacillus lipolyticus TaxID=1280370 RepID=A0ABW5A189_9BACL